jgi:hypothetical protein
MSLSPQISLAEEVINPSLWSLRKNNICTCNQIRVPESEEQLWFWYTKWGRARLPPVSETMGLAATRQLGTVA